MFAILYIVLGILCFSFSSIGDPICSNGSIPAYYSFPIPAVVGQCSLANIPPTFGIMSGDFSIQVTAIFNNLNGPGYIFENGISGEITGLLTLGVFDNHLITWLAGTPACMGNDCAINDIDTFLQTSEIPLAVTVIIVIQRTQDVCSLLVNGTIVVTVACTDASLIPPPSDNNIWSIVGVGAQKSSSSSCGVNTFLAGSIISITLQGGKKNHISQDSRSIFHYEVAMCVFAGSETCRACYPGSYTASGL